MRSIAKTSKQTIARVIVSALALSAAAVFSTSMPATPAAQAAQCQLVPVTQLNNGGFELPVVTPAGSFTQFDQSSVPGWSTTDANGKIEIWSSGFNGVIAYQGDQFAEINATSDSRLFQDVVTTPGATLYWSLAHKARRGEDVMRVLIGPPGGPLVQSGPDISDSVVRWGVHTGVYEVPAGQTMTRFGFESVSTGSGSGSIGNFLDAISFSGPACIDAILSVSDKHYKPGQELIYELTITNTGGADTTSLEVSIPIPPGTSLKDGSITPGGQQSGTTVIFQQPIASSEPGVLAIGESIKLSFTVIVDDATALLNINNTATITVWPLNPTTFTSNTVTSAPPQQEIARTGSQQLWLSAAAVAALLAGMLTVAINRQSSRSLLTKK